MQKWTFLILIFFYGCGEDSIVIDDFDLGSEFLPILEEGAELLYQVDQKIYSNEGRDIIEESFFQREEAILSEMESDNEGSMRLDIFRSKNGAEPWSYHGAINYEVNNLQSIFTSLDNQRIVNLTFPIEVGKKWDGLAFIEDNISKTVNGYEMDYYEGWEFEILGVDETFGEYSNVLTVQMADYENAIQRRRVIEKYEYGVGLIYQEIQILDTQCIADCAGQEWSEKAHNGISIIKQLVSTK